MSRYGEPGAPYGGYPGQPGEPGQPYDPPSDPWGQGGGDLTAPAPGYPPGPPGPPPVYPPGPGGDGWDPDPVRAWEADLEPGWGGPPPGDPPSTRRSPLLFIAVGLLVVVVAGAVAYALYLLSGEDEPAAGGNGTPGPAPSGAVSAPATPDPGSTQNNIGLNAAMAREGDCLTNLGTDGEPQLQIVPCDSDESGPVYQVLTKVDSEVEGADRTAQDASAQQICGSVDGYTHHYFEVSESLSFVLCMAEREPTDEPEDEPEAE